MFAIGLIEGPLHHFYYMRFLEKIIPGSDTKSIFMKIAMDQVVASPLFITTFFYGVGVMEGKNLKKCTQDIRENIVEVYLVNILDYIYFIVMIILNLRK